MMTVLVSMSVLMWSAFSREYCVCVCACVRRRLWRWGIFHGVRGGWVFFFLRIFELERDAGAEFCTFLNWDWALVPSPRHE